MEAGTQTLDPPAGLAAVPDPEGPEPEVDPEFDPEAVAAARDAATEPEAEPKPVPPMQIALPGDWDSISADFGGNAPERSEIRLMGGKMPIEGSFPKGAEFDVLVRVKVTGVLGQDTIDDFGETQSTVRRHHARMLSVKRVN